MNKITFENGKTPINDTNLNQIQDNVEKEFNKKLISNIEELKSLNLEANEKVRTLGYYSAFDEGGATYLITNDSTLTVDESFVISLNNGLKAKLIIEDNKVNIKSLGARSQDKQNNHYDIAPYIEKYLSKLAELNYKLTLYIPTGVWYCSPVNIIYPYGFSLEGDSSWQTYACGGTTISSIEENQEYIFKIGSSAQMVNNFNFKNITLSSGDFLYYENGNNFRVPDANTKNIGTALELHYTAFGVFENLAFNHLIGETLSFRSTWEMRFDKIFISNCSNIKDSLIVFKTLDKSLMEEANISNIEILELNFEAVNGNLIKCEEGCCLIDSIINNLHFEPYTCLLENSSQHELDDGKFNANTAKHLGILNINGGANLIINNIILNNVAFRYIQNNGLQYIYDTIFNITNTNKNEELVTVVNNIIIKGMKRQFNLILQEKEENVVGNTSSIAINNIANNSAYSCIYNVKYFPTIINNAILRNTKNQMRSVFNNSFNAFCDYTRNADNDLRRFLYYDEQVLNNSLLAVKPIANSTTVFCNTSLHGTKLNIRAKIENGKTYKLTINNTGYSASLTSNLVGTGSYKNYEIDLSSIKDRFKDNPTCILYSASTNTADIDVSLDYFYFE